MGIVKTFFPIMKIMYQEYEWKISNDKKNNDSSIIISINPQMNANWWKEFMIMRKVLIKNFCNLRNNK